MIHIYFLDLLGVFSFALYGAYIGLKKQFDLFGICVIALLNGLGGGTIREMILGKIPLYLTDYNYIIAVGFGIIGAIILYKHFHKIQKYFLSIDAIGLATFAFIGAQRAALFHLSGIAIVLFATITAVGGGILRDIALREIPYIFRKDFYATPALLLGILYAFCRQWMNTPILEYGLIILIFLIRILAIRYGFRLWSQRKKPNR